MKTSLQLAGIVAFLIIQFFGEATAQNSTNSTNTTSNYTYDAFGYVTPSQYSYTTGGAEWTTAFANCGLQMQSPIDIGSVTGTCDSSMVFNLQLVNNITFNLTNSSSGIQGTGNFGQLYATDVNGILTGYTANLFKIHSPSEHSLQGQFYDAEFQLYFDIMPSFTPTGNRTKAAISFMLSTNSNTTSNTSSVLTPFGIGTNQTNATLNFSDTLQGAIPLSDAGTILYYTYQGSLTQPPCNETVNWFIISGALPISQTDLIYMNSLWVANATFAAGHGNNRAEQLLNARTIKQGGVACEEQFVYFFSFFILYIFINYFIFKLL
eukprot:CAMPEP_0176454806 /NCGR_PEP_ID=MMETSP0127-20121128/30212_1 /TAXON_ID=938130 /ORGANISM="Platyophrya macrostoma, Strain WH" /LENGTH=321 /DNA_ID=CAMNT_0017844245 /DNA_START=11 /DNA_END=976 /DNA_ORIENTATION=-